MVKLEQITFIHAPIDRCFDLARSVEVHLAGNVHWGEQALATGGRTSGLIGLREQVTWRAKHFGYWHELSSKITRMDRPRHFRDEMTCGIFRSMDHDHFFRTLSNADTEMRDIFRFSAPALLGGSLTETLILRRYMDRLLTERNDVIRQIAESAEWRKYIA